MGGLDPDHPGADSALAGSWLPRLVLLSDLIRRAARAALMEAVSAGSLDALARPVGRGVGDVTYGLDAPAEAVLSEWLSEMAKSAPLSLLTEDAGWRHMGPGKRGEALELPGFDHGGPRIVVDPIDGTRMLMSDLRPAWSVIGLAGPGTGEPRLSDLLAGVLSEIPDSRAARYRRLAAARGQGCWFEERGLADERLLDERRLESGTDDRVDHGYFPFFRYMPDLRPEIAKIEAAFFARLAEREGADVRACWDDQYISNGGQLALLALGRYRMIADLRAWLADRRGQPTLTSKPYDIAGAVICAQEAGCEVTAVDGSALDFPLDAKTPVSFVGWVNRRTRARLEPHLREVLREQARPDPMTR
jgi:fructose-1,6-bisphosphatase/inositol monophosphatase family enzyme